MSNLYNWHDERMNELKIREISREIEHLELLREAERKYCRSFQMLFYFMYF
jgi:hypothetical protein